MKLGPILAALGGGLAGSALLGGGGSGGLMGMSPLLALLLRKKNGNKSAADPTAAPADPSSINVTQNPMLRQMGGITGIPQQQQQPMMRPPGAFPIPFGPGSQNPYGYGRY